MSKNRQPRGTRGMVPVAKLHELELQLADAEHDLQQALNLAGVFKDSRDQNKRMLNTAIELKNMYADALDANRLLLDMYREEIRELKRERRLQPVSMVLSDGTKVLYSYNEEGDYESGSLKPVRYLHSAIYSVSGSDVTNQNDLGQIERHMRDEI